MNMKDARALQPGAIVREAWYPESKVQGIVLSKQYVKEKHKAKMLCRDKEERFDITVHWLGPARTVPRKKWADNEPNRVQVRENWEIMIISHVSLDSQ